MVQAVIACGKLVDGRSNALLGPTEVLIGDGAITELSGSVGRPAGAEVIDLSDRTVSPGSRNSAPANCATRDSPCGHRKLTSRGSLAACTSTSS